MIYKKETIKKLVKSHNRKVTKANIIFDKLSPAEKRVQIARDVIAQLDSKRLVAITGAWLSGPNNKPLFNLSDINSNLELKEILAKTKKCVGCALGGMFMCAVERADKLRVNELQSAIYCRNDIEIEMKDAFSYLKNFFSKSQLELIECAFERGKGGIHRRDSLAFAANEFVKSIDDSQVRMRLIMENIIKNNGTFKPHQKPICVWQTPGFLG